MTEAGAVEAAGEGDAVQLVLDVTPCYAEGGGQVGDAAKVAWDGGAAVVQQTVKGPQGLIVHRAQVARGTLRRGPARARQRRPRPPRDRASTTPPPTCCTPPCGASSATTSPRRARW